MFNRWGQFVVRRAWWVIAGWLVGAFLIIGLLPSLADITSGDQGSFLPDKYESVQAINPRYRSSPTDGQGARPAGWVRAGTNSIGQAAAVRYAAPNRVRTPDLR